MMPGLLSLLALTRGPNSMRKLLWTVAMVALATSLDSSIYGGFYTQSVSRMLSHIAMYVR